MKPADTITDVRAVVMPTGEPMWRLMWQTPIMPGVAFEYFETKAEADKHADCIKNHKRLS